MTIQDLKTQLATIAQQLEEQGIDDQTSSRLFGKQGQVTQLMKLLPDLTPEDRKSAGVLLNQFKTQLENQIELHYSSDSRDLPWVDLTQPAWPSTIGHLHPITQAIHDIATIFENAGFIRVRYPEVDYDWYVFESLNMPPSHPARDEWETFFVEGAGETKQVDFDPSNLRSRHPDLIGGRLVLTTHTSNGQVREMERLPKPPIRMVNIARCYRRQQDTTHTQMFHQFEGLVVDEGITIQHLKGTLDYFAQEFYGPGVKSRIRPFHFRFTEPSFEVDFSCHLCGGTGVRQYERCRFCKSGWHEVGGAGMVHPNVLKAGNIDPDKYTGFAFGWGVERTYTLRDGMQIDDIRQLYANNREFLEKF